MECIWEINGVILSCYNIIISGLVFDILGALFIAFPLWNLKKRFQEEFDLEVTKKEYFENKEKESISIKNPNKKRDGVIDGLTYFSNMFLHGMWAVKDQRYIRIGIVLLLFGFLLQLTGNIMQHLDFVENYV